MKAAFALVLAAALAGCDSAPKVTFSNASITLPEDPIDLPEGPGRQAVIENCTACHSPSTMLQQPRIPREKWEASVAKMIKTYKAPIDAKAIPQIVDYLVAVQAREVPR
jgi:cytochrome c553